MCLTYVSSSKIVSCSVLKVSEMVKMAQKILLGLVQDVPLKNVLTGRKVMDEPWRREWMLSHCAVEVYFVLLFSRRWFQGFNWEGLRRRKLTSPLRREVKHRFNRFYNVFTYVTLCKKRMPILLQLWNSHLLIFAAQRTSGSQSFRHVSPWAWRTPRWILWLG